MNKLDELVVSDNQLMVEQGKLYLKGCCCQQCFHVMFPYKELCLNCASGRLVNIPIGNEAALKAYTISYVAPEGFQAPLIQALILLKEGPEIFALIEGGIKVYKQLFTGMKLYLVPILSENEITGWMYKPVLEERHE